MRSINAAKCAKSFSWNQRVFPVEIQTSLNDLDKAEEASKLRSPELAAFPPVSDPKSRITD